MRRMRRVRTTPEFRELCRKERELVFLARDARAERDGPEKPYYCANEVWYGQLKPRLEKIVGWGARRPIPGMSAEEAYDIAYDAIYAMLPNCRNCNCA